MPSPPRIGHDILRDFVAAVFARLGLPPEDAMLVADSLVQADLWGHQSHGVLRAPWYAARLRSGAMRARSTPEIVTDARAICVIDGQDGVGQVLAARAAREAIARAQAHGVGVAALRNSNHFGTAMYFTLMAACAGCIGFLSTNASPAMPPFGGRRKLVGNNPWSIAAPAGAHPPMVLDIANTAVARGKIHLARRRGEAIPPGWALTSDGAPTTDPQAAIDGLILPMAGHKGYGIAVMMDVLSGILTGSQSLAGVHGPYEPGARSGCGHLFIALDIAAFRPRDVFATEMETLIATLKSAPRQDGIDEIFYPGEIEARHDLRHRAEGLDLPADTLAELRRLGEATGVAPP